MSLVRFGRFLLITGLSVVTGAVAAPPTQSEQLPDARVEKAMKAKDYASAIVLYRQILKRQPENGGALLGLGRPTSNRGSLSWRLASYNQLLRRGSLNRATLTGIGKAYNLLGQYPKAEAAQSETCAS